MTTAYTAEPATFRYHLKGLFGEFLEKTHFKKTVSADSLLDVAAGVAYHVEEGHRLFPEVVICGDIDVLMKQQAPNSQFIQMGAAESAHDAIPKALKKLSPLTSRDWLILLEVKVKWTPKVGQRGTVPINQERTVQHVQETTPA